MQSWFLRSRSRARPAHPPRKIHRVGLLAVSQPAATWRSSPQLRPFLERLQQLGYMEGQNLAIEYRSAESKLERLPELAAELVALKVDVLWVGTCGAPLTVAMHATTTIPIVVGACSEDMVAAGIVQSLARPRRSEGPGRVRAQFRDDGHDARGCADYFFRCGGLCPPATARGSRFPAPPCDDDPVRGNDKRRRLDLVWA